MVRTGLQGRRSGGWPRIWGEVALATGFLVFAGALTLGVASLRGTIRHSPALESSAEPSASPTASSSPQDSVGGQPVEIAPGDVASLLSSQVAHTRPVLVLTALPPGATAYVTVTPAGFAVEYRAGTADIVLSTASPGWERPDHLQRTFRGVTALYQVTDPTMPQEGQFLMWIEPRVSALDPAGVPYFLKVGGMTEAEFWKLANSIQPLPAPGSGAG